LTNCSFFANGTTGSLGTVALWNGARAEITNCTFARNVGPDVYAGVFQSAVAPIIRIKNSILWSTIPAIVLAGSGSTVPVAKVSHCDVLGGYAGRGNISANPQFLSTASGNVRLLATSPCLDRGDGNANGLPRTDFEGDPRRIGARVDIGADEYDPNATQLWGNLAQLSVSRGGNYTVAGSGGKNGEFGVLLASLSGTAPGFDAGGVHVPVNLDGATEIVLAMPGAVARFQASGRWSASLAFPSGMPRELAGKYLHCVLLRVLPSGVTTGVSSLERLVLVP
ncbi:MAG: hypothetical protein KDC95_14665, partial [Planctomycetes bacterium]|nr:hypothetical protein [Planctomycetota bacterium]